MDQRVRPEPLPTSLPPVDSGKAPAYNVKSDDATSRPSDEDLPTSPRNYENMDLVNDNFDVALSTHTPVWKGSGSPSALFKKRRLVHIVLDHSEYLDENSFLSRVGRTTSWVIMALILVSTLAFVLQSIPDLRGFATAFEVLEWIVSVAFTVEYVSRMICSRSIPRFIFTLLNMIDLMAIVPFYLKLYMGTSNTASQLRVLRVVRLARVFRLFKMSRHSRYIKIFATALKRSVDAFYLLLFFILMFLIIFSSLMFYAEKGSCLLVADIENETPTPCDHECTGMIEDKCQFYRDYDIGNGSRSPFISIPHTFWWCMATMTTVGYGDVFPTTFAGKLIGCCTMVSGILILALPISVLGTNFQQAYELHASRAQGEGDTGVCSGHKRVISDLKLQLSAELQKVVNNTIEMDGGKDDGYSAPIANMKHSIEASLDSVISQINVVENNFSS